MRLALGEPLTHGGIAWSWECAIQLAAVLGTPYNLLKINRTVQRAGFLSTGMEKHMIHRLPSDSLIGVQCLKAV